MLLSYFQLDSGTEKEKTAFIKRNRSQSKRDGIDYSQGAEFEDVFGSELEATGFSPDGSEDEYQVPIKKNKLSAEITKTKRGLSQRRRRGPRRRGGITRAEFLQQHEKIVADLDEDDAARGLAFKSRPKTIRKKFFPVPNEGIKR